MTPILPYQITSACSILSRCEAKSRLQNLIPGSEEHSKLQAALLKTRGIVEIDLPTSGYRIDTSSEDRLLGGFGSSEHIAIGEAVQLNGLPENAPLLMKGITPVRFQHIVALAGDFYGVAGEAISLPGGSDAEKTNRFEKAFNTLAQADHDQVRRILVELDQECTAVKHSSLPHHCYSQQMIEKNNAIEKIKNDINELLVDNSDHFSTNAEDAYRIGHTLALKEAVKAGQNNDLEGLKRAYALDAFACHFLTDLFASGHIRNQRGALETFLVTQLKFSGSLAKKLAGILTGAQHEKDGNEGLNVSNKKGDSWRAYGDGLFFAPKSTENRKQAIIATQKSVGEIYEAYTNPATPLINAVDQLIPHATPFNPPPLYSIEGDSLFLYEGSYKVGITTQFDYLQQGLSQALRYLPQKYIDGFIAPHIQMPPLLDKVIAPQITRLTGIVWATIGIATYHQLTQNNEQLNEKVDEMADVVKGTCENTSKILEQMGKFNSQLAHLSWTASFQDIKESIGQIKDLAHQHKLFRDTLSEKQRKQAEEKLWAAYLRISSVLSGTTAGGENLLANYENMLKATSQEMTPPEIKMRVTLWFRQLLDYQVQAFCMYGFLAVMRDRNSQDSLKLQALKVESNVLQQIEANKKFIDTELIFEKPSYITLQLEKDKTKRLFLIKTSN